jgi:hypothetical protein
MAWPEFGEVMSSRADFVRMSVGMPCWFEDGWGRPEPSLDWGRLDETLTLARMRGLRVLGVLDLTPKLISSCHDPYRTGPYHCPPSDLARYGEMAGEIAYRARATITHWEILNEPDQVAYFSGTPEDYARMLAAAYDGIKARVPEAQVVLAGLSRPRPSWMERVFATPGADAARKFDVASIHIRGRAHLLPRWFKSWRRFLERHGFAGPLWVTEHGYPGDPAFQYDARFRGGEHDQAAYLTESVLSLGLAGAERVFVTLTDMHQRPPNAFSSEGITNLTFSHFRSEPPRAPIRASLAGWRAASPARSVPETVAATLGVREEESGLSSGLADPQRAALRQRRRPVRADQNGPGSRAAVTAHGEGRAGAPVQAAAGDRPPAEALAQPQL